MRSGGPPTIGGRMVWERARPRYGCGITQCVHFYPPVVLVDRSHLPGSRGPFTAPDLGLPNRRATVPLTAPTATARTIPRVTSE